MLICPHCFSEGLYSEEYYNTWKGMWCMQYHCVYCGEIVDEEILARRRERRIVIQTPFKNLNVVNIQKRR